MSSYRHNSG